MFLSFGQAKLQILHEYKFIALFLFITSQLVGFGVAMMVTFMPLREAE